MYFWLNLYSTQNNFSHVARGGRIRIWVGVLYSVILNLGIYDLLCCFGSQKCESVPLRNCKTNSMIGFNWISIIMTPRSREISKCLLHLLKLNFFPLNPMPSILVSPSNLSLWHSLLHGFSALVTGSLPSTYQFHHKNLLKLFVKVSSDSQESRNGLCRQHPPILGPWLLECVRK